ncbi:MAG: penicillin-binding protein 2 [Spirochaetia bacterium]
MGFGSNRTIHDRTIKLRIILFGGIVFVVMFIYLAYLFSIQIVDGYIYTLRADEVRKRTVPISAQRGQIYDRNYDTPLATNIDSFAVVINPADIPKGRHEEIFTEVSELLEIPLEEIKEKVPKSEYGKYQMIQIQGGVRLDTINTLAERINKFPGVDFIPKPTRYYVESENLSHVLGFVGDIAPEEVQILFNKGYTINSVLGKNGIEKQYDMILRGKDGKRIRLVDAQGRKVSDQDQVIIPPVPGNNIVLTINRDIQKLCADALGHYTGSVVVLKPSTGEILAMVSYPNYDPNIFYSKGGKDKIQEILFNTASPQINRSIQSGYVPASTFKIVMSTAVLEENVFPETKTVTCNGKIRLGNREFKCHKEFGHGPLNLAEALAESCNVFFWTMGYEYLKEDLIADYCREFGFGFPTGIDLPDEKSWPIPTPEWKEETYNSVWVGGDTMNMSIGQGFYRVTPLQMADVVAMVVNEGIIYKPYILKEVRDPVTGKVIQETQPEILQTSSISKETFRKVKENMRGVITEGTAEYVIYTKAVSVAGKTGTGETGIEENQHSLFVAYAPYDAADPDEQVVVAVMIEGINEWNWWAPKAANIIFHGIFKGMNFEETVEDLKIPAWYNMPEAE